MVIVGNSIPQAATWLQNGFPVAIPTETVYGLAANACDPDALLKVFAAKKRPLFDPLIVHLPSLNAIVPYTQEIPPFAYALWERYSPGPLTLVLRKSKLLPDLLSSGLPTAGFRIPAHPIALDLLNAIDFPLAAPSANLFGRVSPTTASHVVDQLGDTIPYILDGGPCLIGLESTIIDLSGPYPVLLREGGIPSHQIEDDLKISLQRPQHTFRLPEGFAPSPGTLESHYAPIVPMKCYHNNEELSTAIRRILLKKEIGWPNPEVEISERTPSLGMLRFQSDIPKTFRQLWEDSARGASLNVEILSQSGDLKEAARNFFAALRKLERDNTYILAEKAPDHGLGLAINDRLQRGSK